MGINNDGNDKVGYTAPGFRGQAAAIRAAHAMSGVTAETIGYVEAHGTGTILGDPIELSALTEVFNSETDRRRVSAASARSNRTSATCPAPPASPGLIKTVLVLEHGAIPPTLHYQTPNPAIDFAASPFYVTTSLQPWERNGSPRRASVSSFGVGGTNAHAGAGGGAAAGRRLRKAAGSNCWCCRRAAQPRSNRCHYAAGRSSRTPTLSSTWPMWPSRCSSGAGLSAIAGC